MTHRAVSGQPTGQFRVGSARTARPYPRTWAARSPPHSSMPPPWRPLRHRPARPLLQLPATSFRLPRHLARGCGGHHMALSRRSPKRRDGGRRWPDAGRGDKGARPRPWSRGEEEAEIGRLRRWWRKGGSTGGRPLQRWGRRRIPVAAPGCGLCRALRETTQGQGRSGDGVGQGRRRRGIDKVRDRGGSGRWRKGAAERGHGVGGGGWQRIRGEGSRGRKAGWWLVDLGFFCCFYMRWKGNGLLMGHIF
jgi:hypothetical protein